MTIDQQTTAIANAFGEVMREWLSPAEFAEMKLLNETDPAYAGDTCCASHNYCDANMAMDAAFRKAMGREPQVCDEGPNSQAECRLWNEAWALARNLHLGFQPRPLGRVENVGSVQTSAHSRPLGEILKGEL